MKNILIIFFSAIAFGLTAQSNGIAQYIDTNSNNDDFTTVSINKKMFEMLATVAAGDESMDPDIRAMINDLDELKIITTQNDIESHYKKLNGIVEGEGFEELMIVNDKGSLARFMVKDSNGGNIVDELILLASGDEFVLIDFIGKIDLTKVAKLAKSVNVNGMEHLEKIKKD